MISVIICTYNREKYIFNVLESIAKNDLPASDYEIVLIDNNCTDNTKSEVDRFTTTYPQICLRYFVETEQGLSAARNRGIKESAGDILIYVDDDAFVNSTYLSNYSRLFKEHPEIDAAGGPIIPHYECGQEPQWMTYHLKRLLTGYLYFGETEKPFPGENYPGGGNAAYRTTVFEAVGLYNTKLGRTGNNLGAGEEKDIFNKMKTHKMQFFYTPRSILYHSIPDYKLGNEYLDKVTLGIGSSERNRTLAISKNEYTKRLLKEAFKWGGTIALSIYYFIVFRPTCAQKLIQFRSNVTKGLLSRR